MTKEAELILERRERENFKDDLERRLVQSVERIEKILLVLSKILNTIVAAR